MAGLLMSDSLHIKSLFRDYQVHFVDDVRKPLQSLADQHAFFVVDAFIWGIYKKEIEDILPEKLVFVIEATEEHKSLEQCGKIIETLVDRKVRRNQKLVAVGGGIIQDVTAFSASIIYRGIEWAFFPTTLLAQADSCVGSKTSINLGNKKNLIGNFYPPTDVFIGRAFLDTLSVDDIKSGIGEIVHFYLYADSPLFEGLIDHYDSIIENRSLLMKHIQESLLIKKSVIEIDEFDRNERNKFNYGHTFGHAIESMTGYSIKHGQAVTVGMDLANYISMESGLMNTEVFGELHRKLSINFPVYDWNGVDYDQYVDFLSKDKKNVGNDMVCILARRPGMLIKQQLALDSRLKALIAAYFTEEIMK